jgi:putative ABC transport system ATP-binding protein
MLKAQGLRSVRDGQQILANVDVIVEPGESLAVTGPSGSGKTTLLSLLSGLARPTAGEVYIDGQPLTKFAGPALGVAVVLQGYGLVSLLTAAENIEVAMRAAGRSPAVATRAAREMLAHLGLEAHADQLVEELSGGQQQRTAVARALALEPRLLIADEPTAELDPAARAVALARMFEVALNGGSLILATHDPEVADRCDRILDLSGDSPAVGPPPGQAAVDQPPPDPVPASPAPPDQAGADQLSAPRPAIELSTLRPLAAEQRAPVDRPAEEPPSADVLPADQAPPGQLPAEPPPLPQAAQRERLISSALPPMHRRGARLRSYLDEVRRRAYQASAWLDARDRQAQQAGPAGLSPAAEASAGERELLRLARDDLAGFADLGLRLLELHQPMDLGAGTGDPSSSVPRCLTCMWRWPCPTFLILAEIMENGPGQA